MRVQYTLPGYQPLPAIAPEPGTSQKTDFRSRTVKVNAQQWAGWRQILHLDRTEKGPAVLDSPPRPAGMERRDAASERTRWRLLLDHHRNTPQAADNGPGQEKVEAMLSVLKRLQQASDAVACRAAGGGRW